MKQTLLDSINSNADSINIDSHANAAQNTAPESTQTQSIQNETATIESTKSTPELPRDSIKTDSSDSIKTPQSHQTAPQSPQNTDKALDVGDFEILIQKAKLSLSKLSSQEITLKESLELYQQGMDSLKSAQEILESAKLHYQEIKD